MNPLMRFFRHHGAGRISIFRAGAHEPCDRCTGERVRERVVLCDACYEDLRRSVRIVEEPEAPPAES